ncbi:hypothetical protein B0H16DRAFT_1580446 [Mycena metata]|uniref:Tat pathway signal sequence n=1 Tax=Mycena metata TaxID=1033252 RepID=A0AAD7I141_9AGAR|nr:hypothetical protein B0H16DRAFT_1580446 [Mycena metata]
MAHEYTALSGDDDHPKPDVPRSPSIGQRHKLILALVASNVVLLACLLALGMHQSTLVRWRGAKPLYSPVQDIITYESVLFPKPQEKSRYHGPPTDEVDQAWIDLYDLGMSAIPKSQAARLPNRTEPFSAGSDTYLVSLTVFHNLHCLNMIRKSLWPERYSQAHRYDVVHGIGGDYIFDHLDHCVNSLRLALTCAADITPHIWRWNEKSQQSTGRSNVVHTCKNWDAIHEWAERTRITTHYNYTIHVLDDLVFPDDP